tara:strand:+ start:114 stop:503 length:390 start_codon:yes stop_codon:yes gene_type:complete
MKSKDKFLDNFKLSLGNISISCEASGISRQTYYNWRKQDAEFSQQCEDIEERNLDLAEMKLLNAIREGKTAELLFYLKTKGKRRGYVERQEITGIDGQQLFEVRIIDTAEQLESNTHEQSIPSLTDGQE